MRTRLFRLLSVAVVASTGVMLALAQQTKATRENAPEWEVVGRFGMMRTVYVSPNGLKDKTFVAQVLHAVMTKESRTKPIQVMLFDDKRYTPKGFPMTDAQMLHLRAQYNRNPNTRHEEFVWISVVDAETSPPRLKQTKANIRPGVAE